jgi:hypothetical protein
VEAGADARVPEIGLNFETTDDPDQACENSGSDPTAVHITSDISAAFHVFGGLKGQTPISVPLLVSNLFKSTKIEMLTELVEYEQI